MVTVGACVKAGGNSVGRSVITVVVVVVLVVVPTMHERYAE